jgi:hypothetical protein
MRSRSWTESRRCADPSDRRGDDLLGLLEELDHKAHRRAPGFQGGGGKVRKDRFALVQNDEIERRDEPPPHQKSGKTVHLADHAGKALSVRQCLDKHAVIDETARQVLQVVVVEEVGVLAVRVAGLRLSIGDHESRPWARLLRHQLSKESRLAGAYRALQKEGLELPGLPPAGRK